MDITNPYAKQQQKRVPKRPRPVEEGPERRLFQQAVVSSCSSDCYYSQQPPPPTTTAASAAAIRPPSSAAAHGERNQRTIAGQAYTAATLSSGYSQPTTTTTTTHHGSSSNSNDPNDSFDDGGIDWDAAAELLDRADAAAASASATVAAASSQTTTSLSQHKPAHAPAPAPKQSSYSTTSGSAGGASTATATAGSGSTTTSRMLPPHALPRPPTAHGNRRQPAQQRQHQNPPPPQLQRPSPWNPPRPTNSNGRGGTPQQQKKQPSPSLKRPPPSPLQASATTAAGTLQCSLPSALKFDPQALEPVQDELRQTLVQHAQLSAPMLNGWTLFGHQKRAVLRGLLMRRAVLALDMGTGKTLTACVWARAYARTHPHLTIIVICPVSLKEEWKRTAEQATGLAVQVGGGEGIEAVGPDADNERNVYIASWQKVPQTVPGDGPYVVVADEAHQMQSMTAARTNHVLKLVNNDKNKRCVGVLLLTGTPMKNGKPQNLFPLLRAVQHPMAYSSSNPGSQRHQQQKQRAFEEYFCAGQQRNIGRGRLVWQAHGASNLEQLRLLTASHILYLKKEDVLKDLPPRTRDFHHVPVSSRSTLQHQKALQDLEGVYNKASTSNSDNKNDAILGMVQKVRLVGSLAKVDPAIALAKQILQTEPAIVIFSNFVQVCKQISASLQESGWQCELLTGETPPKKRQGMVDNFQNGLSPVFCCTFGAGGVGLTLTAACTIILVDRPWTPGDADQAEDRVRRIGQTRPVTSIWLSAFELDKQIDLVLAQKKQTAAAVLGGDENRSDSNNASQAAPRLSIFQMLRAILPGAVEAGGNGATISNHQDDGMKQTSMLQFSQPLVNTNTTTTSNGSPS